MFPETDEVNPGESITEVADEKRALSVPKKINKSKPFRWPESLSAAKGSPEKKSEGIDPGTIKIDLGQVPQIDESDMQ